MLGAVTAAGCYRTPAAIERDFAKAKLQPTRFTAPEAAPPSAASLPARALKVRVYADAEHRAQVRDWEERFTAQARRANELLGPQLHLVLEFESFRLWERQQTFGSLDRAIRELEALDPAREVDLVVGLVSSLPSLSTSLDEIGMAPLFGRHMVLRGMASAAESDELARVLEHLSDEEVTRLKTERRLHKETSVLLHEFGHTLGVFHQRQPDNLMSPVYSVHQSWFSADTLSLLKLGATHRDQQTPDGRAAWGRAWRAVVEQLRAEEWDASSRKQAEQVVDAELEPRRVATALTDNADIDRFNGAVERMRSKDAKGAAALLAPLVERLPHDARVQTLACQAALSVAPESPLSLGRCRAAMEAAPDDAFPCLAVAQLSSNAHDTPGALEALGRAQQRIAAKPEAGRWVDLAHAYLRAQSPTLTEAAVQHVPMVAEAEELLAWVSRARRWNGLVPGAVAPAREHEVITAMTRAVDELNAGRTDRVDGRISALRSEYPKAAAAQALACRAATLKGREREIRASCTLALAAWDELIHVHLVLGLLDTAKGDQASSARHLARTVELDPSFEEAWLQLARVYRLQRQAAAVTRLEADYQARFGHALAEPVR